MRRTKFVFALCLLLALPLAAGTAAAASDTLDTLKENISLTAGYADSNYSLKLKLDNRKTEQAHVLDYKTPADFLVKLGDLFTTKTGEGYDLKLSFGPGDYSLVSPLNGLDLIDPGYNYALDPSSDMESATAPGAGKSGGPSLFFTLQFKF